LKILLGEIVKAGEKILATTVEIENQKQASINNLHTTFENLHNILEKREKELVKDATSIAEEKLKNLSQQKKMLTLANAELQSVVDYNERCVSLSTDNELVSMDTEHVLRLSRSSVRHKLTSLQLQIQPNVQSVWHILQR